MNIKDALQEYKELHSEEVVSFVVDDIMGQDDMQTYINDVMNNGCVSGTVSSLIYYSDTDKFFISYHDEIFDLLNEYKEENGEYPTIELNSNNLAWFTYEKVLFDINSYLESCYIDEEEEEEEEV